MTLTRAVAAPAQRISPVRYRCRVGPTAAMIVSSSASARASTPIMNRNRAIPASWEPTRAARSRASGRSVNSAKGVQQRGGEQVAQHAGSVVVGDPGPQQGLEPLQHRRLAPGGQGAADELLTFVSGVPAQCLGDERRVDGQIDGGGKQVVLRGKEVIDQGLVHPGAGGHAAQCGALKAEFGEQAAGSVENLPAGRRRTDPTAGVLGTPVITRRAAAAAALRRPAARRRWHSHTVPPRRRRTPSPDPVFKRLTN